ncbi:hypothetical protein [Bacteroides sp.]|uniref:hypothetical protein n=1 Tax=Bacteroides sp. TaxID=29523 RepID=UPI002603F766|nr:hypothetical protein [Bacteroides sp.]MDD3039616.1 hypothetical protein [Bacteroides sp.]
MRDTDFSLSDYIYHIAELICDSSMTIPINGFTVPYYIKRKIQGEINITVNVQYDPLQFILDFTLDEFTDINQEE